jgi:hypothetical protein
MEPSGYVAHKDAPGFGFDAFMAVQRGRRREVLRTAWIAVGLLLLQTPMRGIAEGSWASAFPFDPVVPARLSLVVDGALIATYLLLAYRAQGLFLSARPSVRLASVHRLGIIAVTVGAALDVVEDVRLWVLLDDAGSASLPLLLGWDGGLDDRWGTSFSAVMQVTVFGGLAIVLVTTVLSLRGASARYDAAESEESHETGGDVICCSGGGIRSAAFSLGGMQALADEGVYEKARAVIGVSGGGYTAAAYHVMRWSPADQRGGEGEWPGSRSPVPPPFGSSSAETGWVRRNTTYVLGSMKVALQGALSLGFGIAVNLLLLGSILGGTAWVLAWYLLASGRYESVESDAEWDGFGDGLVARVTTAVLDYGWLILAVGAAVFVLRRFVERWRAISFTTRRWFDRVTMALIALGGALTLLVVAVPELISALESYAEANTSVWADLVRALGLASPVSSPEGEAATAEVSGGTVGRTLGTIVGAILAVLASLRASTTEGAAGKGGLGSLSKKVWSKIKDPVVPWLAAIVLGLVVLVVTLRWVRALLVDPGLLAQWQLAYVFGGLLLLAKLLTDANRSSMHHFFRERISGAFLVRPHESGVQPIPYGRPLRYSDSTPRDGGPELVSCAVANATDPEIVPSKRGCVPFIFDSHATGLTDRLLPPGEARRASAAYEFGADHGYHDVTLAGALAISAAAFSPMVGRENARIGPYRAVLALANARLGVWLPNPLWVEESSLFKRLRAVERYAEAARVLGRLAPSDGSRPHLVDNDAEWKKWQELCEVLRELDEACDAHRAELRAGGAAQSQRQRVEDAERALRDYLRRPELGGLRRSRRKLRLLTWRVFEGARTILMKPGLTRLTKEAFGQASIYDRFLYVTDGGHYDNLGLIEALRRKPERIFVLDASNDAEDTFRTLGRAIATARMDLDCEVDLDPRGMRRLDTEAAQAAWAIGSYTFATGETGTILLAKAVMLGDLSWDLHTYAGDNVQFPRTSTGNQLYSEFDFEAYRSLGHAVTSRLVAEADADPPEETPSAWWP